MHATQPHSLFGHIGILFSAVHTGSFRSLPGTNFFWVQPFRVHFVNKPFDWLCKMKQCFCWCWFRLAATSAYGHRPLIRTQGNAHNVHTPSCSLRTEGKNYPVNTHTPSWENISNPEGPPPTIKPVQSSLASEDWLSHQPAGHMIKQGDSDHSPLGKLTQLKDC